jgi:hypothetical protein
LMANPPGFAIRCAGEGKPRVHPEPEAHLTTRLSVE